MSDARVPSVSVVIPLYNKAEFIERTLKSVLAQAYADYEVIVVDDGSSDGGADRAQAMGDERIRVARYANAGVSAARNRGASLARAPLIAFLDADDLWKSGFLKTLVSALDARPQTVAAFCAFSQGALGKSRMPRRSGPVLIEDYPGWFMAHGGRGLWSSNAVLRAETFRACGGFPEGVQNGEDTDTWFRLSFVGPVLYVPQTLSLYGEDDRASLSRTYGATEPLVIATLTRALAAGSVPPKALASSRIAARYFRAAYATALAQGGKRREALRELSRSLGSVRLLPVHLRALVALVTGR